MEKNQDATMVPGEVYFNAIETEYGKADVFISYELRHITLQDPIKGSIADYIQYSSVLDKLDFNYWNMQSQPNQDEAGGVLHILGLLSGHVGNAVIKGSGITYRDLYRSYMAGIIKVSGSITPNATMSSLEEKLKSARRR